MKNTTFIYAVGQFEMLDKDGKTFRTRPEKMRLTVSLDGKIGDVRRDLLVWVNTQTIAFRLPSSFVPGEQQIELPFIDSDRSATQKLLVSADDLSRLYQKRKSEIDREQV